MQRIPRSHSSASLRSRSALALSLEASASLRYRTARALLMAPHISALPKVVLPQIEARPPDHSRRASLGRMQIALEPAAKSLRMHRIVRAKRCKSVTADRALKRMQVHAGAFWLDAEEHHWSFALWTGGALKGNRWNGGRRGLRLGHDAFPQIGGSTTLSVTGIAKDTER